MRGLGSSYGLARGLCWPRLSARYEKFLVRLIIEDR